MLPHHENNGECARCTLIFNRYPNFYAPLQAWFKLFQAQHPEAHVSCAGRGQHDQDMLFYKKASKAMFGQSAHNWNSAIDVFCMINDSTDIYDKDWFYNVLAPEIPAAFNWYGRANAPFPELPHIELSGWEADARSGELTRVSDVVQP